ncbi:hypothetical protein [Nesterenkonia pannonica]|uniref:hypothetical protein n=1 Tax=Nesterenkonia pannonica TaxID=1548602 RepID=UPI002164AE9A|nr:hypothetical protein [Nesterenkonia pannonica]
MAHLTSQLAAQGRRRQHSPLLPPLECALAAEDGRSAAQLGLVDLPLHQRQEPLVLDPHEAQTFGITGEPDAGGVEPWLRPLVSWLITPPDRSCTWWTETALWRTWRTIQPSPHTRRRRPCRRRNA